MQTQFRSILTGLLVIILTACSAIQEKVSKTTAKTVTIANMCNKENIENTVSVQGLVGRLENTSAHPTIEAIGTEANPIASFLLVERFRTPEETREAVSKGVNLSTTTFVLLPIGVKNNQVEYHEPFNTSKIRTSSGQVTSIGDRLHLTGKVIQLQGSADRCYLQDVTIEKP